MRTVGVYTIIKEIGHGSFAIVYKASSPDGGTFAIKTVPKSKLNKKLAENLETEISILQGVSHPHIVQLFHVLKSETEIHLIMEYCSMGDLAIFIKRRSDSSSQNLRTLLAGPWGGLCEMAVRDFLGQISSALEFLRSKSLIHRDLKPQVTFL